MVASGRAGRRILGTVIQKSNMSHLGRSHQGDTCEWANKSVVKLKGTGFHITSECNYFRIRSSVTVEVNLSIPYVILKRSPWPGSSASSAERGPSTIRKQGNKRGSLLFHR